MWLTPQSSLGISKAAHPGIVAQWRVLIVKHKMTHETLHVHFLHRGIAVVIKSIVAFNWNHTFVPPPPSSLLTAFVLIDR